jgi:elongation factor Ts
VAVLVEINCESDFVARTDGFKTLTQNIAKHIAMANPQYVKPEDIPANVLEETRQGFAAEAQAAGNAGLLRGAELDAEVEKKLKKFYEETCLVQQPYVLDEKVTIGNMITQGITDLKENIVVRRFVRYELGA